MRYYLHISYDGSSFRGWQCQPRVVTVQETLENAFEKIFKVKTTVIGCGRTDAGVHASQYIMHVYIKEPYDFDLKFRLNKNLPSSIAVYDIIEMDEDKHARYDAISRSYDYFIHSYETPVLFNHSSLYTFKNLDITIMQKAAALFTKYNDYEYLCKQPEIHNHTLCDIKKSVILFDQETQRLQFSITANRFLRGMIRVCVHFLLEVGYGNISLQEFENLLTKKQKINIKLAKPNGLYLSKIEYPYLKLDNKSVFFNLLNLQKIESKKLNNK